MLSRGDLWQRLVSYVTGSFLPQVSYVVLLGGAAFFAATHPKNGWDMLGYIGVIESWHTSDNNAVHDAAYSAIRHLPEYNELTGNSPCEPSVFTSYRADVAQNSAHFVQQLPFYSVKPLYLLAVSVLHRGGLSYPRSFAFLSVIGYFCTGVITWMWLSRYWPKWLSTVLGGLLVINPEIVSVGRSTTPDALALMLIALGLYLLMESPNSTSGPVLLLFSIWVRPDALILVGLLLGTSLLLQVVPSGSFKSSGVLGKLLPFRVRMRGTWKWLILCGLALLSYVAIQFFAHPYPWRILFYHSFVTSLVAPRDATVSITPQMFLRTLAASARTILGNSGLAVLLVMGTLGALLHTVRNYRYVTVAMMVSVPLHFLLYPSDAFRFHVAATFFVPISLLIACAQYASYFRSSEVSVA